MSRAWLLVSTFIPLILNFDRMKSSSTLALWALIIPMWDLPKFENTAQQWCFKAELYPTSTDWGQWLCGPIHTNGTPRAKDHCSERKTSHLSSRNSNVIELMFCAVFAELVGKIIFFGKEQTSIVFTLDFTWLFFLDEKNRVTDIRLSVVLSVPVSS